MPQTDSIEKAVNKWRDAGIKLLPPADESAILEAFRRIDRPLTRDILKLFRTTAGFDQYDSDSHLWSLWPLSRIVEEHETIKYERPYTLFADFMINSYLYCFHFRDDNISSVCIDYFDGNDPMSVAQSVEEFFELYLTNPDSIMI